MGTNKTIRAMSNDILEKGKSMPIGTIHNGFKKIAEGKWRKVSEKGKTKEEHEKISEDAYKSPSSMGTEIGYEHSQHAKKLNSKEYSDAEVMGEENKNLPKGFEIKRGSLKDSGYGFKIGEMDINGETWRISFNVNGSFNHATVFKNHDTRGREISLMNKKLRGLDINQDMFNGVKKDNIQKALNILEIGFLEGKVSREVIEKARARVDEISKGGEGSRGGKIIGHTKSGKPIYEGGEHHKTMQAYHNFSSDNHIAHAKRIRQRIAKMKKEDEGKSSAQSTSIRQRELEHKAKIHEDIAHIKSNMSKSIDNDLEKGKSMPIGTIHNGFKKIAEGKWRKVSEHGMTKEEHEGHKADLIRENVGKKLSKEHDKLSGIQIQSHAQMASKLDSKEYSDQEVLGKEEYKRGDKIEHNGVTIHVGKNKSGGQDTTTYEAPSISDKTFWDLNKLKELIDKKKEVEKALTTLEIGYLNGEVSKEVIEKARMQADELSKGKKANIGEIRDWRGGKYRKTTNGWEPVREGGKKESSEIFRLKDDKDMPASLYNLKNKDLKSVGTKEVNFASGKQIYHIFDDNGDKIEVPERFLNNISKPKATDQPNMREKVQSKVFGEGDKKPNKELLGEHSITKNGEKGNIKVGWSEIGKHYTYSGNIGKASISGNNVSEEKIKELLGSKEKEDKDGSWFNKLEQDYNEKKNQLNLLREDNWNPGFANNFSKSYGEDKFVKTMIVRPETDFKKGENFFTVDCGYSKLPTYGEEANKYHASLDELKSKRFSYAREAAKAADEFASKWNK